MPTKTAIRNAAIDAVRKDSVAEFGLAAKPERSIRTAKKFEILRQYPWAEELAVEMVWFARSQDVSDGWPYERFASRLETKGIELPTDLTIQGAVDAVDKSMAKLDQKFHSNNVDRPMSRRASSVLTGTQSLSAEPNNAESGTWVRARVSDQGEQSLVDLHQTSVRAAKALRNRAEELQLKRRRMGARVSARRKREVEYDAAVYEATARVLDAVSRAQDYREFDVLIRFNEPVGKGLEGATLPLVNLVASQIKPRWKHTKGWDQFADDIAWEISRAIPVIDREVSRPLGAVGQRRSRYSG